MKAHVGSKPVMTVHRRILKKKTLVYLLVGRTAIRYADGRSRIVYIGITSKGASRRCLTRRDHRRTLHGGNREHDEQGK